MRAVSADEYLTMKIPTESCVCGRVVSGGGEMEKMGKTTFSSPRRERVTQCYSSVLVTKLIVFSGQSA